ncbi:hypothetical protein PAXRUDRAFT_16300 [Paxillus rubicundulus Ve08.2h10]|uniref:Uncharacterized protein n=1 Tax=Paxillus rubicundulus Ve08.2h10 TaxID=930991 RepID=A0A0D0DM88_9AGAM|nr:hypothetical protein PAXRUDRAFT_16300 [Paxillus rubicundulus Ve08.2h10]
MPVGPASLWLASVDMNIQSPETYNPYEIEDVDMQDTPDPPCNNRIGRGHGGAESGLGLEEEYLDHKSDGNSEVGSEHGDNNTGRDTDLEEPDGDKDNADRHQITTQTLEKDWTWLPMGIVPATIAGTFGTGPDVAMDLR